MARSEKIKKFKKIPTNFKVGKKILSSLGTISRQSYQVGPNEVMFTRLDLVVVKTSGYKLPNKLGYKANVYVHL